MPKAKGGPTDIYLGNELHAGQLKIFNSPARFRVLDCGRKFGKALDVNTPIPTPTGWRTMGELEAGDYVFDECGVATKVVYATPVMLNHPCYEVEFSDGSSIVADADHQWFTYSKAARKHLTRANGKQYRGESTKPSVVTTEQIKETLRIGKNGEANHAIPLAAPLQYAQRNLVIPPYILGLWLGDGSSGAAYITTPDPEIVQSFRDAGYPMQKDATDYGWRISDKSARRDIPFRTQLKHLGVWGNKHVPENYLHASIEQRLELLKGLMDTDGCIDPKGHAEFNNTNKQLADSVYELVCGLGMKAWRGQAIGKLNGVEHKMCYDVGFTPNIPVFKLPKKLSRQNFKDSPRRFHRLVSAVNAVSSVPVKCIQVDSPNHLYLAGKSCVPTHNTVTCRAEIARAVAQEMRVAYMCPTNKMLSDMWRQIKNVLQPIILDKSEQEHRIECINHAEVEFWSLDNPDGPRPFEYDLVIVDEAALINLTEIFPAVIRPTLMKRHGRAMFASTPRGYDGFYTMFEWGQDPDETEWESWKMPTWDNPHIDKSEIESMRHSMPINIFSQEVEAEFIADAGAVFRLHKDAATATWQDEPIPGHSYVFGVDLAKSNDFSVFAVIDLNLMALVHMDRANQVDYSLQAQRLVALAYRFKPVGIVIEQNANDAFVESMAKTNLPIIPFRTGGGSKALIIEALAAAFDRGDFYVINDRDLITELNAYQMERMASGLFRYGGPRELHDDRVMALALAYHGATYSIPAWSPEIISIGAMSPRDERLIIPALAEIPDVINGWPVAWGGGGV